MLRNLRPISLRRIMKNRFFYTCLNTESKEDKVWLLDSECSNHMTGNRELFVEIDEGVLNFVILGDGKAERIKGKGVIIVHAKSGEKRYIHDVLYVPNLAHNLLSVGQLVQKGYQIHFDNNECKVIDKKKNMIMAKIEMTKNKVFPLAMSYSNDMALKGESIEESLLWHLRYGHLHQRGL